MSLYDCLTQSDKDKYDALSSWCDKRAVEGYRCHGCPFEGDDHWCSLDGGTTLTVEFLDAITEDYAYSLHNFKKPTIGEGICIKPTHTPVNHPEHYNQGGIECIDAMLSAFGNEAVAHFCIVNAFKYVWRASDKNGIEDIDKAIWYLNKYKELTADE